jgi:hypothetical protein
LVNVCVAIAYARPVLPHDCGGGGRAVVVVDDSELMVNVLLLIEVVVVKILAVVLLLALEVVLKMLEVMVALGEADDEVVELVLNRVDPVPEVERVVGAPDEDELELGLETPELAPRLLDRSVVVVGVVVVVVVVGAVIVVVADVDVRPLVLDEARLDETLDDCKVLAAKLLLNANVEVAAADDVLALLLPLFVGLELEARLDCVVTLELVLVIVLEVRVELV